MKRLTRVLALLLILVALAVGVHLADAVMHHN